jgi:Rieske Fe-S protein
MGARAELPPAGGAPAPGRRAVLLTGCAGLAVLGVASCAKYGEQAPAPAPAPSAPVGLAATEVPVGGGIVLADQGAVVTQPVAGTFAAFGTTCPHQGCSVNAVTDGTINCPCHGSRFHLADGSVAHGPAERGLTPRPVQVADGRVEVT